MRNRHQQNKNNKQLEQFTNKRSRNNSNSNNTIKRAQSFIEFEKKGCLATILESLKTLIEGTEYLDLDQPFTELKISQKLKNLKEFKTINLFNNEEESKEKKNSKKFKSDKNNNNFRISHKKEDENIKRSDSNNDKKYSLLNNINTGIIIKKLLESGNTDNTNFNRDKNKENQEDNHLNENNSEHNQAKEKFTEEIFDKNNKKHIENNKENNDIELLNINTGEIIKKYSGNKYEEIKNNVFNNHYQNNDCQRHSLGRNHSSQNLYYNRPSNNINNNIQYQNLSDNCSKSKILYCQKNDPFFNYNNQNNPLMKKILNDNKVINPNNNCGFMFGNFKIYPMQSKLY